MTLNSIVANFQTFKLVDLLDILIIAFLIYQLLGFVNRTRAGQLAKGALIVMAVYLVANILNMRTVTKHDITQLRCRIGSENLPFKPILCKLWQHSGMINMCMCEEYIIHFCCTDRKSRILIQIRSLFHTAVNQNILSCYLQKMTASRNLMGCTYKC